MYGEYIAEGLGTFVFLTIILTRKDPVMIAVALLIGILIATIASQGHLNPAVTGMVYLNNGITGDKAVGYIAAQVIAAIAAVQWTKFHGGLNKTA
jgi:glycerol uptake facilitator-like aquaporin